MFAQFLALAALTAPAGEGVSYFQGKFDEALASAKSSKKPVLIDFYTDWCYWCKQLDKNTFTDASVQEQLKGFVNYKIDAEKGEGPAVAKRYGVQGFPTLVLVDGEGNEIDRIGGYQPPKMFAQTVKDFQAGKTFQNLKAQFEKNPDDSKVLFPYAQKLMERDNGEKATELFNKIVSLDPDLKTDEGIFSKRELAKLALFNERDVEPLKAFAKQFADPKYSVEAHRILAQVFDQMKDLDAAEASFEFVQKNEAPEAEWANSYAWFLATNDRKLDRALELANKAVELSPKAAGIWDTLAEVHFRMKNFDKAVEAQKKALDLEENKKNRKEFEERLKKFEEAAKNSKG